MCLHLYMIEFEFCTNSLSSFYPDVAFSVPSIILVVLLSATFPMSYGDLAMAAAIEEPGLRCGGLVAPDGPSWEEVRGNLSGDPAVSKCFYQTFLETKITGRLFLLMIWWGEFGAPVGCCNSEVVWEGALINQAPWKVGTISSDKCGNIWSTYTIIMYFCFGKGHVARHQECWLGKIDNSYMKYGCGDTLHV